MCTDGVLIINLIVHVTLRYYLSCSLSLSFIQSHKHYSANNIHQRYNIDFCCINKISNQLNLAVLNSNDKKTKNYKTLVALATCVLNREYVITNYMYITENSLMISPRLTKIKTDLYSNFIYTTTI